jgi:hypothetical protein
MFFSDTQIDFTYYYAESPDGKSGRLCFDAQSTRPGRVSDFELSEKAGL